MINTILAAGLSVRAGLLPYWGKGRKRVGEGSAEGHHDHGGIAATREAAQQGAWLPQNAQFFFCQPMSIDVLLHSEMGMSKAYRPMVRWRDLLPRVESAEGP